MTEDDLNPYYVELSYAVPEALAPEGHSQVSLERVLLTRDSGGVLVALTVPDADNAGLALAQAMGKGAAVLTAAARALNLDLTIPKPWAMRVVDQRRMHKHLTANDPTSTPGPGGTR